MSLRTSSFVVIVVGAGGCQVSERGGAHDQGPTNARSLRRGSRQVLGV